MDASAICPVRVVIELMAMLLTDNSETMPFSYCTDAPMIELTTKELIDASSVWDTRASRELTSIVLAIWLVTLNTSPWKVLRRSEEMEASPMCPDTTVIELASRLLTNCVWVSIVLAAICPNLAVSVIETCVIEEVIFAKSSTASWAVIELI